MRTTERLERRHEPVTGLFPPPSDDRSAGTLPEAQVAFFHEHGYMKGGRVLDERQLEALREGLEAIRLGDNPRTGELYEVDEDYRSAPDRSLFHILGAWLIDDAFHPVPMVVKAGECLFHHSHTVHGSYGNRSDGPRRGDRGRRLLPAADVKPREGDPPHSVILRSFVVEHATKNLSVGRRRDSSGSGLE